MGTDLGDKTLKYVLVAVIKREGIALYKGTFGHGHTHGTRLVL